MYVVSYIMCNDPIIPNIHFPKKSSIRLLSCCNSFISKKDQESLLCVSTNAKNKSAILTPMICLEVKDHLPCLPEGTYRSYIDCTHFKVKIIQNLIKTLPRSWLSFCEASIILSLFWSSAFDWVTLWSEFSKLDICLLMDASDSIVSEENLRKLAPKFWFSATEFPLSLSWDSNNSFICFNKVSRVRNFPSNFAFWRDKKWKSWFCKSK